VFRVPRPSGGRAIVAREVVQPLSLDKAGDLMLFYRALCARGRIKEGGGGEPRASRGMMRRCDRAATAAPIEDVDDDDAIPLFVYFCRMHEGDSRDGERAAGNRDWLIRWLLLL